MVFFQRVAEDGARQVIGFMSLLTEIKAVYRADCTFPPLKTNKEINMESNLHRLLYREMTEIHFDCNPINLVGSEPPGTQEMEVAGQQRRACRARQMQRDDTRGVALRLKVVLPTL